MVKHGTSTAGRLLSNKGATDTQPPGWLSLLMLSEKANFKRLQTLKFHLHDILKIKLKKWRKESSSFQRGGMGKMWEVDMVIERQHEGTSWLWECSIFFKKFYWGELIYNVMLVSAIQQSELVIHIHISTFRFFSHIGHYRVLSQVPCAIE